MKRLLLFVLFLLPLTMAAKLYIVGTAISSNWERQEMHETSTGIFEWQGYITYGGELKFMTAADGWGSHWGPVLTSKALQPGQQKISLHSSGDYKFLLATEGQCRITVDTKAKTITLQCDEAPAQALWPDRLYPAGTAVGVGSDFCLQQTAQGIYEGTIHLQDGWLQFFPNGVASQPQPVPLTEALAKDATATMHKMALELITDRCAYLPGHPVTLTLSGTTDVSGLRCRYRHLGLMVDDHALQSPTWTWQAPSEDFTGYLAEVYRRLPDGQDQLLATIGIDVSSDWRRFPRYGFVATFDFKTAAKTQKEMQWLNRCHINGVQFQDWHYAHDCPLAGLPDNPTATYKDIANRTNYLRTIRYYIEAQHQLGMKSIFYNLLYGALDGYADRGVQEDWFVYTDRQHTQKDRHQLPSSWKSDIYLVNPALPQWQQYLAQRNDDVYRALDFDGFQIDQLGYRGTRYDSQGREVDLVAGYQPFIQAMKQHHPQKRLVMNAVSEVGQGNIATSGKVDFLYNEVWGNHDYDALTNGEAQFDHLKTILDHNRQHNPLLQTVFAAYMNYCKDNAPFNTPGIVMADAVMFALGGSHLELGGDHMLCREYFPYDGMQWSAELEDWMKHYYDFLVAHENLLRGDWKENNTLSVSSPTVKFNRWKPVAGQVTTLARTVNNRTVVHLLNFTDQSQQADPNYLLCWHDRDAQRPWPMVYKDLEVTLTGVGNVGRIWVATPDCLGGAMQPITDFEHDGTQLRLHLPSLQFWTMLVIDPAEGDIPQGYGPSGAATQLVAGQTIITPDSQDPYQVECEGDYRVRINLQDGTLLLTSLADGVTTLPANVANRDRQAYDLLGRPARKDRPGVVIYKK